MMELFQDVLIKALLDGEIKVAFHAEEKTVSQIIEGKCYQALQKIREILDDDSLDDPECFERIEKIVCVLEEIGSNGGSRHDFG